MLCTTRGTNNCKGMETAKPPASASGSCLMHGIQGLPAKSFRIKTIQDGPLRRRLCMKIAIIGGGPAGLYSAILLKKQRPEAEITGYERNRADDTFGFGVGVSGAA